MKLPGSIVWANWDSPRRRLITFSPDGLARTWRVPSDFAEHQPETRKGRSELTAIGDGTRLLSRNADATQVIEASTGRPLRKPVPLPPGIRRVELSPDLRRAAYLGTDNRLRIDRSYGASPGTPTLLLPPIPVEELSFSPDSKWLLTNCVDGQARVYDTENLALVGMLHHNSGEYPITKAAMAGPGPWIATGNHSGLLSLWNRDSSADGFRIWHSRSTLRIADCVIDGSVRFAAAGDDAGDVFVWNLALREGRARTLARGTGIRLLRFSPGGRLLAAAENNGAVRVWDFNEFPVDSEVPDFELTHESPVRDMAFSPDGGLLLCLTEKGLLHGWDTRSGEMALSPRRLGPQAHRIVAGEGWASAWGEEGRLWRVAFPTLELSARDHLIASHTLAGLSQVSAPGLPPAVLRDLNESLRRRCPALFQPLLPSLENWHWESILAAREKGDLREELAHLNQYNGLIGTDRDVIERLKWVRSRVNR